tara:strand:+ start:633 stop:1166 length:534 start_codon:yes stop_codon:yes gene_type:complete
MYTTHRSTYYNKKRIRKELNKFWLIDEPYVDPLVSFNNKVRHVTFIDNTIYFMLIKEKSNIINQTDNGNIIVTVEMQNSNYPFSPPQKVLINGKNYLEYLRPNGPTYHILEYFIGQKCLCCSTLMCKHNWGPQKNLKDILEEILKTFNLKQRIVEYLHAKKIKDKYLIDDIPIFEYI